MCFLLDILTSQRYSTVTVLSDPGWPYLRTAYHDNTISCLHWSALAQGLLWQTGGDLGSPAHSVSHHQAGVSEKLAVPCQLQGPGSVHNCIPYYMPACMLQSQNQCVPSTCHLRCIQPARYDTIPYGQIHSFTTPCYQARQGLPALVGA